MSPECSVATPAGRLLLALRRHGYALVLVSAGAGAPATAHAVVGGQDGGDGAARAAIMVLNSRGGVCSGIVVVPDVVLTAAHCVAGRDQIRIHYRGPDRQPVLLEPAARVTHPGYVANAVASRRPSVDLALVRLPAPLPGAFATARLSDAVPRREAPVSLGGYGVAQPGDARSSGTFRTAALTVVEPYGPSRILLWASDPRKAGAGACEGDSGGPMSDPAGLVVAVSGWASGRGGRGCGEITQGVLVGPQRSWIDATLAGWSRAAAWN